VIIVKVSTQSIRLVQALWTWNEVFLKTKNATTWKRFEVQA